MHNLRRGLRNIWRSKVRTVTVTILVALSICLAITMMAISVAVDEQVATMEASVGTAIEIRPAGTVGALGRGEPLSMSILAGLDAVPNVVAVAPTLVYQHMSRFSLGMGQRPSEAALEEAMRERFAIFGIIPGQELRVFGGGVSALKEGRTFNEDDDTRLVAIVGATYAEMRSLPVGGTFVLNEETIEVIGIAEAGTRFADQGFFLPLSTAQRILDMEGQLSQVHITVNTLPNVDQAVADLKAMVGDTADVVSQKDALLTRVGETMNMVRGTTSTGLWVSLGMGGMVIFFTMMLIIRERQREIGILKALGSGNGDLVLGFAAEALGIAILGAVLGLILFTTAGQELATRVIMPNVTAESPSGGSGPLGRGMMGGMGGQMIQALQGGQLISQLGSITVLLSLSLVMRTLAAAAVLGMLGGILPALYALRLKPAEVLRHD
ncbi:MAG: ABC transporter permease [Peptococcaceae bacterium]|nr:ABC transporter permease [Peptococcaceae bacterium]